MGPKPTLLFHGERDHIAILPKPSETSSFGRSDDGRLATHMGTPKEDGSSRRNTTRASKIRQ